MEERISALMEKLEKNNISAFYAETKSDALEKVKNLLTPGETIAVGGSMSLEECGIMAELRSGKYDFIDRDEPGISKEERTERMRRALLSDTYLASANALTEDGAIYNVDGNGNRVAAILFGPRSVILVVGVNKIVKDLDAAVERVRTVAAPKNTARLQCEGAYCYYKGECMARGKDVPMGCGQSICHDFTVMGKQNVPGRLKIVLVGEETGY